VPGLLDLAAALARMFVAAPHLFLMAGWVWSARWAKGKGLAWWMLGIPVVLLHLYKNRKDLRGMILWLSGIVLGLFWVVSLLRPETRWKIGVAVPFGASMWAAVWLAQNYGHLPIHVAARVAIAERRSREVVVDAVTASVGEQAKVLDVRELGSGDFEATVVGPAGMPHGDLVERLRDSIAESILRQSGRVMRNVDVVGAGAKGRVRLRCTTTNPYEQTVRLGDLL